MKSQKKPSNNNIKTLIVENSLIQAELNELNEKLESKVEERTERVQHLNKILRAIRNVNQLIVREKDPIKLIQGVCDNLIKNREYKSAWIAAVDEDGRFRRTAESGLGKKFLQFVKNIKNGKIPECGRIALEKSDVVVIEDTISTCSDCVLARETQNRNVITVRLDHNQKFYGFLTVSFSGDAVADEEEKSLFKEVAGDVAYALYNIEQEEERKKSDAALRESELKWRSITENSPDHILLLDRDFNIQFINRTVSGLRREEEVGTSVLNYILPEYHKAATDCLRGVLKSGEPGIYETEYLAKDGGVQYFEVRVGPVFDSGKVIGLVESSTDITHRKNAEIRIEASLKEKEILLKEIHHRVKNNMQIIYSLINLQSREIKDENISKMFAETQNRVRSMALIHEKLYQSSDLAKVELNPYIRKLTLSLYHSYKVDSDIVRLKTDVENVYLDINKAIPCGLIINELVTNSLKHAFPEGNDRNSKGYIKISLKIGKDKKYTMTVADNGIGFPDDVDFRKVKSLGLQLVDTLVQQLDGSIRLDKKAGTTFRITFPR